ncbi:MAG: hypothetical protein ACPIOQ_20860, partial [Promethearchaeia archaeon]
GCGSHSATLTWLYLNTDDVAHTHRPWALSCGCSVALFCFDDRYRGICHIVSRQEKRAVLHDIRIYTLGSGQGEGVGY